MTPEEAERIVQHEAERQDAADILNAAQKIVRQQRREAIAQRTEAIEQATLVLDIARERIALANDRQRSTRLGSGASDADIERFLAAKATLAQLEQTPLPGEGEAVLPDDIGPRPTALCETDKVEMRADGSCPVCGGRKTHQPVRPSLDRLKPFLARGHGFA